MREKIQGIYCISNSKYFYIGQSTNIYSRWTQHRNKLKRNKHDNIVMQRVYNKMNDIDPFKYEIVKEVHSIDNLAEEESSVLLEYIYKYPEKKAMNIADPMQSWSEQALNKARKAHLGHKHSEETKRKISEGQKGNIRIHQRIPVVQISLDGELIKIWDSIIDVRETLGINVQLNRKTSGGFQWQRYEEYIKNPKGSLKYDSEKSVSQYSIDGVFIKEWKSISEASKALNIRHCNINNTLHGKQKTAGGFIWK